MDLAVLAAIIGAVAILLAAVIQVAAKKRSSSDGPSNGVSISGGIKNEEGITVVATGGSTVDVHLGASSEVVDSLIANHAETLKETTDSEIATLRAELHAALAMLEKRSENDGAIDEFGRILKDLESGDTASVIASLELTIQQEKSRGEAHLAAAARAARQKGTIELVIGGHGAIGSLQEAVELDSRNSDSWTMLSTAYLRSGNLAAAEDAIQNALRLGSSDGDRHGRAAKLNILGEIHRLNGNLEESRKVLHESADVCSGSGDRVGLAGAYSNLGALYWNLDRFDRSESYLKKALELEEQLGNKLGIASDLGSLGVLHLTLASGRTEVDQHLDAAERRLEAALEMTKALDNNYETAINLGNLGMVFSRRFDRLPESSPERIQYATRSLSLVSEAMELADRFGFREVLANQYSNLGVLKEDDGDMRSAVENWSRARELYGQLGMTDKASEMQQWIDPAS